MSASSDPTADPTAAIRDPVLTVACDAQIIMWAYPWGARAAHESKKKNKAAILNEMRRRSRLLMRLLDEQGAQVIIPSVAIAEYLQGIKPSYHASTLAAFKEEFFCPSFDISACPLAAKLWQFERGLAGVTPGLPDHERSARAILKSDVLIVASAKMAGATIFYSHELKCLRLAKEAGMEGRDLPMSSGNWITDLEVKNESVQE